MTATADRLSGRALAELPVSAVRPNPDQPRKMFKGIDELAASIRSEGLLQPITVRPAAGGGYVIIAGERRFRAIQSLGWETRQRASKRVRRYHRWGDALVIAFVSGILVVDLVVAMLW